MTTVSGSKVPTLLKQAIALEQKNSHLAAADIYRQILAAFPARVEALRALLNICAQTAQWAEVEAIATRWIELDPKNATAWTALTLARLSQNKDAIDVAQRAAKTVKDSPDVHEYLGVALRRGGRLGEAIESFKTSLKLRPNSASTLINMANTLKDMGAVAQSIEHYKKALQIDPSQISGLFNLGVAYCAVGEHQKAKEAFIKTTAKAPRFAEAHNGLGMVHKEEQRTKEAEASFRLAVQLAPSFADAHYNLGLVLHDQGRTEEALAEIDQSITLSPDNAMFRVAKIACSLPVVPTDSKECELGLATYDSALDLYSAWRTDMQSQSRSITFDSISTLPFWLAYREGNQVDRLSKFGDVVNVTTPTFPSSTRDTGDKIRIGIVSNHIRRHSVWDVVVKGLVTHLDRSRFELTIYHLGHLEDAETQFAKDHCDHWVDAKKVQGSIAWANQIHSDSQNVLFYPELGMDPTTYLLAKQRLAPLQIASWGHPVTSGLATIDWYCSGTALEPENAQTHYREKLQLLPGCGCCTETIAEEPADISSIEAQIAQEGPLLLFPQMPFKLDPADDDVIVQTAAKVGTCTLVIPKDEKVAQATDLMVQRLKAKLSAAGANCRVSVIPWLSQGQFRSLLRKTDVYLDCPSFSGYTTAWMAVREGTPIVTIKGPTMRQRLAAGLLETVGVTDTIAQDKTDYVRIASKLAKSGISGTQTLRQTLKSKSHLADSHVNVVRHLETLVTQAVNGNP